MEITWLGRNCFRLKARDGAAVITDPLPADSGYSPGKLEADLVTLSRRDDPEYSSVGEVKGDPRVFDAPGEYEVRGILVTSIATKRSDGSRNMIHVIEIDGIRVVHLGLPDAVPAAQTIGKLNDVDVLLMPVGGGGSLAGDVSTDVMETIDPRVVIPMNYKTEFERLDLEFLDRFLKETSTKQEPAPKLSVTRTSIPSELTVQVLQPKG